jgi:iron complex outermembrane receptor protein
MRTAASKALVRTAFSASAMATALFAAHPAVAQTEGGTLPSPSQEPVNSADGATAGGSQEIVVTAQFRAQSVQDTPLAITAIDAEMLEARSQTRISDITAQAPNVLLQVNPAGQGNSMRAFIRGIGQTDQSPSVEPGVGIYVDDVYFATITGSIFDLMDLDRVEILRGPQGTLAGMNSVGGSVKLFSRKPTGQGGYVEATLGNFDRRDFRASVDFAIVPDQLFARISGVTRHRDGHVTRLDYACVHPDDPYVVSGILKQQSSGKDCKIGTLGNQSMSALRGSLRWVASPSLEVNISGDYTKDESETQAAVLLQAGEIIPGASVAYQGVPYDSRFVPYGQFRGDTVINDPYVSYANFYDPGVTYRPINTAGAPGPANGPFQARPASNLDAWGVSGKIDLELSDTLNLESITGYRKYKSFSSSDNDSSPVAILQNESLFTHKQFSQELRLNASLLDDQVHLTVGGIYFYQKTVYQTREDDPFLAGIYGPLNQPTFHFIQDDPMVMKNKSGFAHVTWDATDRLSFAGGLRVTHEQKDYTFYRLNLDGETPFLILSDPSNPLNGRTGSYEGTVVDYRANMSYDWTDDVMTYFQFATGFKGGGISPRPYFPQQILGFGPEKLKSYEVGLKTSLFDRRLRFNAAAFYMDYADYQATPQVCVDENGEALPLPFGTPGLCGQYLNVADATVKGFEAELQAEPVDGLSLDASLSYLDFAFGEPKIATNEVVEGASRPGIGDWKWSVGAQYEIPFVANGTLTPRVDVFYTPGYCGNLACTPIARNESYTLANARLTYRNGDNDWSIALEVTNLFDKLYYLNKFVTVYANGQPGRPREWAITLRKNF